MTTLLGISGSLRRHSFNSALLRAAADVLPTNATLEIASIAEVPLYNGDVEEQHGIPAAVTHLKTRTMSADGLLIVTPEYNNSLPGVLKNVIDWMSRPAEDVVKVFGQRPVAIIGASPGNFGTILSQDAWLPVVRTLRMRPWLDGRLMVSRAGSVFDANGTLIDEKLRERLREFMAGFVQFAAEQRSR